MSRRMNKADFALLVNKLVALNDAAMEEVITVRSLIRAGMKKTKKAAKKTAPATT